MSDLLGIAGNAVNAYQLALATVSNNIANVATDGYSRQAVDLREATPRQLGGAYIGTGVVYDRVKRQYDAFAELNLRNSTSELASQSPMVDYANRVVDLMGSEDAGLVSAMDSFFSSARSLSTDPASSVLRGEFLRDAQGLASRFGLISSQLDLVDTETREAIEANVASVNTLGQQLSEVNAQLSKQGSADRQPAELMDQRDRLLRELSELARVRVGFSVNGSVTVSLGASDRDVIVDPRGATRVDTVTDPQNPDRIGLVLGSYGQEPRALTSLSSGKLAGLLSFREQVLESSRNALDDIARTLMNEVNALHRAGVDGYGQIGGDLLRVQAGARRVAGALELAIDDPLRVAAAAQFRVIEDANNTGRADAVVRFSAPGYAAPPRLDAVLPNNPNPSAGRSVQLAGLPPLASVGSIPAGLKDVVVYLNEPRGNQQLQLITRDGRHLLGTPQDPAGQQALLGGPGMVPGASYSASYLGQSGASGYRDIQVFYGARADARPQQAFDSASQPTAGPRQPALLQGERIPAGFTGIAAGALTLNGVALPTLQPPAGRTLTAVDVAAWINTAPGLPADVKARAVNEVRVPADRLQLDRPLLINGTEIPRTGTFFASPQALVDAINAKRLDTGVQASLTGSGDLVLGNVAKSSDLPLPADPNADLSHITGRDIHIEPVVASGGNALNIAAGSYTGRIEIERRLSSTGQDTPIEMGFGVGGRPSDLAALGLRTGAYLRGNVPDDVLVLVSDGQPGAARVSATYQGQPLDAAADLRAHPMEIRFVEAAAGGSPLRFRITDLTTQTVLAERDLDPAQLEQGFSYRGLQVSFSSMPRLGDRFLLDGNADGSGNNDNIRALAALQSGRLMTGGKTMAAAYIDQVNQIGNTARQAAIAQDALQVVRDQAVEKRDQVAGVNLDDEAANLIRFQQAYQASARVMQLANQLFDVMVRVR